MLGKTLIFSLLFLSCQGSQEKSFIQLTNAFFDWYYKAYPVVASQNGIHLYDYKYPNLSKNAIDQTLDDLNRFIIELDQIDDTKLSKENQIDYKILNDKMDEMKFDYEILKNYQKSMIFYLKNIKNGLKFIDYESRNSFYNYLSRLNQIPAIIDNAKINVLNKNNTILDFKEIEEIESIINDKNFDFYERNINIDTLDFVSKQSRNQLNELKKILQTQSEYFEGNSITKNIFDMKISYNFHDDHIYKESEIYRDLNKLYEKMLKIALPIFLVNNDEPVWINKSDTIQVINNVLSQIKSSDFKNKSDFILERMTRNIKNAENNHLFKISNFYSYKFTIKDKESIYDDYLTFYKNGSFSDTKNIVIESYNIVDTLNLIDRHSLGLQDNETLNFLIMKNIFPGNLFLKSKINNKTMVRKSFENISFQKGWNLYAIDLMLNTFSDYDNKHKLIFLEHLVKSIINYIIDYKLNTGLIDKNNAIDLMIKLGFYSKHQARLSIDNFIIYPTQSSIEYLSYKNMKNIEKICKKKFGRKFNLKIFNEKIISLNHLNFEQIKNEMLK